MSQEIVPLVSASGGALSAEHYQTFEMAKEHDTVLGGDNIAQIRSYAAYARAQAQALHKTIAATSGIDDVAAIKAEATETAQTFAKVGIYADQRIGELLRELPTRAGKRTDLTSSDAQEEVTKADALQEAGIARSQAYDLEKLAANPDLVELVIANAEISGTIPSRAQVLTAIKEREQAKKDADTARKVADRLKAERDEAREEVAALERQNDQLYEQANAAQQPQVIERVVESDAAKKRISELEHLEQLHSSDNQKLRRKLEEARRELEKAKVLIGEKQRNDSAEWDIAALTTATNNYLRQYGGKAWAFDQFYRVDETTQTEFIKAINNLAAFAQNLAQMIKEQSDE